MDSYAVNINSAGRYCDAVMLGFANVGGVLFAFLHSRLILTDCLTDLRFFTVSFLRFR